MSKDLASNSRLGPVESLTFDSSTAHMTIITIIANSYSR